MSYQWLMAFSLAKLLVVFALFYVFLPARLLPQDSASWSERFQQNLLLMVWITIVLVHLLALAGVYSIVFLLLFIALLFAAVALHRHADPPGAVLRSAWQKAVMRVLDLADGRIRLGQMLSARLGALSAGITAYLREPGSRIHAVIFLLILIASASLRFSDALLSAATAFSDPYSHLLWMKQLQTSLVYGGEGVNQFYPRGFPAFAAVLDGLTALDGAIAMRLIGPLVGTLLVVGVYFVGRKVTENPDAALFGMFVYGVLIGPLNLLQSTQIWTEQGLLIRIGEPGWFLRQTAALSFEFAMLFLMPTLFAAQAYLRQPRRRYLMLSGAGLMVTVMSNLGVAAINGIGLLISLVLASLLGGSSWRARVWLLLTVAGAVTLGTLQYLYGMFVGENTAAAVERTAAWMDEYPEELPYTLELLLSAALGGMLLLLGLVHRPGSERSIWWRNLGGLLLVLALLSRLSNWGYAYLLPPDRLDIVRVFLLCSALAPAYQIVTLAVVGGWSERWRPLYQSILAVVLVMGSWAAFQFPLSTGPKYEYEALARISYDIKRRFPPLQWTLVSLTEDFSKVFRDKGWHMNAADFLDQYDPYSTELELPTPYVFLFVEKRPYGSSSDASLNVAGVRGDIERRMQEWTAVYGLLHQDMSVYFEDWDVTVYLIATPADGYGGPHS